MRVFPRIAAFCLILGCSKALFSQSLLVHSKRDHTLAIVDPATLTVVAKVPVGNDPHEVIASAYGQTAFVSNYGLGAYNTFSVVDLVARKPLPPSSSARSADRTGSPFRAARSASPPRPPRSRISSEESPHFIRCVVDVT